MTSTHIEHLFTTCTVASCMTTRRVEFRWNLQLCRTVFVVCWHSSSQKSDQVRGQGHRSKVKDTGQRSRTQVKGEGHQSKVRTRVKGKDTGQRWRTRVKGEGHQPKVEDTSQRSRTPVKGRGHQSKVKDTGQRSRTRDVAYRIDSINLSTCNVHKFPTVSAARPVASLLGCVVFLKFCTFFRVWKLEFAVAV